MKGQGGKETRPWVWYDEKSIPVKIPFLRVREAVLPFTKGRTPYTLGEPPQL